MSPQPGSDKALRGRNQYQEGKCCAEIFQQEVIADADFEDAYNNVKEVYVNKHYEYDEPDPRGGQSNAGKPHEDSSKARTAYHSGDFTYTTCLEILESARLPTRPTRAMCDNHHAYGDQAYITYGMFTHGGVHGITTATKDQSDLVRYLNGFAKYHLGDQATWTSISVTKNVSSGLHRDSHNDRGSLNHCVTFGQTSGGGLWLEVRDPEEETVNEEGVHWRRDKTGAWVPGKHHDTHRNFIDFDPFLKHASLPWTGDRWGLVFHTVRQRDGGSSQVKKFLKNCGFPMPKPSPIRATDSKPPAMPRKAKRNEIANTAGKLSVLFTTLMVASSTFIAEAQGTTPSADPTVMMEIGGYEGTLEAVKLDKTVVEPMEWSDLLEPDKQERAHQFITKANPRELRVHLDNMPQRCYDFVLELIRTQLSEGGEVVLRGKNLHPVTEAFKEYISYHDPNRDDGWIVMRRAKRGQRLLPGHNGKRPHEVHAVRAEDPHELRPPRLDGSGITFGENVAGHVKSALRRLHQNLGHPRQEDLLRHLRLAGCEPHILKAVKSMRCEICQSTKKPAISRPTTLPRLLDFNSCVGIDLFYVHDISDQRHTFLSMVDWATAYHVVAKMDKEASEDVERAFNSSWINPFGAPYMVSLDLDPKIQSGTSRLCDWHNIKVKDAAAQAHWQAGVTERQGGWFKGIWDRVVQDLSLEADDVEIAGTLVCAAKNELRRRCGHSPTQWVFGKLPRLPPELGEPDDGDEVTWDLTKDSKFQRMAAIRASARVAFHKAQGDDRLRRALLQRARTQQRDFDTGDPVHFWEQPKDRRRGRWVGPAVVVGRQGANYWISRSGKCRLTAPEHLRASGVEEVGEYLMMKGMRKEVENLLAEDLDEPDVFEDGENDPRGDPGDHPDEHMSDYELSEPDLNPIELDREMEVHDDEDHEMPMIDTPPPPPTRRLKRKTRPVQDGDEADQVMLVKRDLTRRGHAKRQEKELLWSEIPPEARPLFKEAEKKQWLEHLNYDALQALSVEESRQIREKVPADRVLKSRWAYKDKNWAARQSGKDPEWRCKSRLIIGGHLDPDLGTSEITTDAPTLSRPGLMCLLQLLANGLREIDPWEVAAGDIQCAFLTGSYLNREEPLYLQQPGTGFPGLLPEQLVIIKKNIFGLATSPHEWWEDLQRGIHKTTITLDDVIYGWVQCPLDPCIFMLKEKRLNNYVGKPIGYVATHVDDILVIAPKSVGEKVKEGLSRTFPIDKWEVNHLDYIGSEIEVHNEEVRVSQKKYVETRLFTLEVPRGVCEEDYANAELAADNKSLIGALSWLSAQTRPDLTCSVSLAQQLQKAPTYGDIKFTNAIANRAVAYKDQGLTFKAIPLSKAVFLAYHDAAWANAMEANEPGFELYGADEEAGLQKEGPYSAKERKAKRANSKVASQVGALVVLAEIDCVYENRGNISITDWKSRAGQRVCRSTFGAETQASVEGLEAGQYMRSFIETVAKGELITVEGASTPLICLSDCRSLYDHIHKEGVPRVPSDRRLAIDLAALRQGLRWEKWYGKLPLAWMPSSLQFADVLTKPMDPGRWWEMVSSKLALPIDVGGESSSQHFCSERTQNQCEAQRKRTRL